jgi:hypothetical protein
MVFLEGGRRVELAPAVMQDDSGTSTVQRGRFTIESSDRYQIELLADSGLRNPNPGTYPISALQDYAPVGRWLLPDDEGTPLLPEALLCVRFEAHDDFGLSAVNLAIEHASKRSLERELLPASTKPTTRTVITSCSSSRPAGRRTQRQRRPRVAPALRDNRLRRVARPNCRRASCRSSMPAARSVIGRTFPQLARRSQLGARDPVRPPRPASKEIAQSTTRRPRSVPIR